jgi:hypothetical protein
MRRQSIRASSKKTSSFVATAAAVASALIALLIAAAVYGCSGFRSGGRGGGSDRGAGSGILPGFSLERFSQNPDARRGGNAGKCTFIYYHMPGCPHCTAVTPTVDKIRNKFDKKVVDVKYVQAGDKEARDRNITGFPAFELMTRDGNFIKYEGDRSYSSFNDFILKNKA